MATALTHEISYDGISLSRWMTVIEYGKCTRSPHVENGLWFVTIPRGDGFRFTGARRDEFRGPEEDHTFLVEAKYARPFVIDDWKRDIDQWTQVAHKIIKGSWCPYNESLWIDVPVFKHQLPDGKVIKYGYCRSQSKMNSERELWFVAFREGPTFIVDHVCVKPDFINRMGSDTLKWQIVCWCRLMDEVRWDDLITGTESGGVVRTVSSIHFDSPHLPFSLDEIDPRIKTYEEEVPQLIRRYKIKEEWNTLDDFRKGDLIRSWEGNSGKNILHNRFSSMH